jgi:tRNA(Leu) C34 or U34 (ribose-2'-O)-methylase TrmL
MDMTEHEPGNYTAIGLYQPKFAVNAGSVLRAAGNYRSSFVAIQGKRYKRACTDTMASYRLLPLIHTEDLHSIVPFDCVPVAVEVNMGYSLIRYTHPKRAFYIFGPEDGSLGEKVTSWCRDIISIPTQGCMNLAATVNVVLYDRMSKAAGGTKSFQNIPCNTSSSL